MAERKEENTAERLDTEHWDRCRSFICCAVLRNQFTVPLFILPVIVHDLISARNSTRRLTHFVHLPEIKAQRDRHAPSADPVGVAGWAPLPPVPRIRCTRLASTRHLC